MAHKKDTFEGWKNCLEVSSGNFKLVVATEIGPRILGAFFEDSDNLFYIYPKTAGRTGDKKWNNYGGHRLWHSPEEKPRTYTIENSKVDVRERGNSIVLHKGPDSLAGIEKTIEIIPFKNDSFKIIHTLRNWNRWEVELAAWAITVMAPGGELASTVRLPPTAPPARLPVAAVTAASIPVCSHIWAATQIIARSPNNMQRGVITNPNATVRKRIGMIFG